MQAIQLEIANNNISIFALTEIKPKENDAPSPLRLCPSDFNCISIPRKGKTGGGLALIHKTSFTIKHTKEYTFSTMECSNFSIQLLSRSLQLCLMYRLPDTSVLKFCQDISDYMELNITSNNELILMGNFNIHMNNSLNLDATLFEDTLKSFGLHNHINFGTHQLQNT